MQAYDPGLTPSVAPARVLLVEDDMIIAINTEMMLQQIGVADVQSAGSVAEALALLEGERFDFGVLDFSLGDETSLPVAIRLSAAKVPMLFTTGYVDIDLPEDCREVPILRKPYRLADLKRMVLAAGQ